MRAYKRRKLKDHGGDLEVAVSRNQVRTTYAMVKRVAPVPTLPPVTMERLKHAETHWSLFCGRAAFSGYRTAIAPSQALDTS